MIPSNIKRLDVLKAINLVDSSGVPPDRHSVKWSVLHESFLYPPKYLISLANIPANGEEWPPSKFSGGDEANGYLSNLGFEIIKKSSKSLAYPLISHSWTILSDTIAVKRMDKSSFLHHGTAIPFDVKAFFDLENLKDDEKKTAVLHHKGKRYRAHFQLDPKLQRTRLFWRSDFVNLLKRSLPDCFNHYENNLQTPKDPPLLRFKKTDGEIRSYVIEIINPGEIDLDVDSELAEEQEPKAEGAIREYYGKRYERNTENRRRAIEFHGTVCSVCGFDFETVYGDRGKGFIEIHHTKPLSLTNGEVIINPETDLIPVCPNCHRMIHRRKDHVLSIGEISDLIQTKRNTS